MGDKICCFAGHRTLPADKISHILKRLHEEIEKQIQSGITTFISGGALGFDQMAAAFIAAKKETGYAIDLILALPCRDQDARWDSKARNLYRYLLKSADEVVYVSDAYTVDCMKKRNRYMVDHSTHCICALLRNQSGTAQAVHYAKQR